MIIVTGSFVVKEGRMADALALSTAHVKRSGAEDGCISHAVHIDAENLSRLFFFEEWRDQAALAAHFVVPESRAFGLAVQAMAVDAPKLSVYQATKVKV
jgi:quinol monooxygenase YgiN